MKLKASFLPFIFWWLIVTILLCIPGTELPKVTWLNQIWFDKWVHIGLFFVMVVAGCWGIQQKIPESLSRKRRFIQMAIISLSYGIIMELIQNYFIPFRSFDNGDIIADGLGSMAGYLFSIRRWGKNKTP